jgi:hypothetical protein
MISQDFTRRILPLWVAVQFALVFLQNRVWEVFHERLEEQPI